MSTHWVDYGFGTPKMVHTIYILKLLVLYIAAGLSIATFTSGYNVLDVGAWWNAPIVYQKLILWTLLVETLGLGGSWGPLAGHFKPMMGGALFWLRPGTIRLPPWPGKVPLTSGDTRTVFDVLVYAAILVNIVLALGFAGVHTPSVDAALPGNHGLVNPTLLLPLIALLIVIGLRDKVIFIAARGEQYFPAIVFFGVLPFVDMIVALKLLIVSVWVGAGISKLGHHFSMVVPPMLSNTLWLPSKTIKRAHYRSFPNDLRPSIVAGGVAHVLGTVVEVVTPLVLLFTTNGTITLLAVALMVAFHLFILSTFPLAVPLEWNLLFAYAAVFLFLGFPNAAGFGLGGTSPHRCCSPRSSPRWCSSPSSAICAPTSCRSCLDAAVRRKLGLGDLGIRTGCGGQAGRVHHAAQSEHPHPVAGDVSGRGRRRRDAPAARLEVDAQPGPRPVVADESASRDDIDTYSSGRPSSAATHWWRSTSVTATCTTSTSLLPFSGPATSRLESS